MSIFTQVSHPPVISYGEQLATWLAVWTFSQVVSISALQAQGRESIPTMARNATMVL